MAAFDCVIRGGDVFVSQALVPCDIGIRDGRIVALGEHLDAGDEEIDASGRWVLPGGVDAHCHLDQPMSDGAVMADNFETGTRSAVCGGTTTVIPFACQFKGQSVWAAIEDYHQRASQQSYADYAFHLIVSDPTPTVLQDELPRAIAEGYTSFKIYMTYEDMKLNDRQILETLMVAKAAGAIVMVHAENADCIDWLTELLESAGHTTPEYHAKARPSAVEREATHRAITFSELVDVPILIVHVSGAEAIEQIDWARRRGLNVFAETCPQYVFLTSDHLHDPEGCGHKFICSPPPRDQANQKVVWNGLRTGTFQVFSSDHAPFNLDDPKGKALHGKNASFSKIPNGIPGLETRLPLLFSAGVTQGQLSLARFVNLTSTYPARLYGLFPQKGVIAIGADADFAIWDPHATWTIANADLHHAVDYTPYEGITVTGRVTETVIRGRVVQRDGRLLVEKGSGQFLRCHAPDFDLM